jgi:hypothetical protein
MFRPCIGGGRTQSGLRNAQQIHNAGFAALPLFGVQLALGRSLYSGTGNTDAKKGAHAAESAPGSSASSA